MGSGLCCCCCCCLERGVVWEETLILLPDKCRYVFLSATIPNASGLTYIHRYISTHIHTIYTRHTHILPMHLGFDIDMLTSIYTSTRCFVFWIDRVFARFCFLCGLFSFKFSSYWSTRSHSAFFLLCIFRGGGEQRERGEERETEGFCLGQLNEHKTLHSK